MSGYENQYAALRLSLPGADIIVEQFSPDLEKRKTGDAWLVSGDSVALPGNLTLRSTWGEVRRAYGRGTGGTGEDLEEASYHFCAHPYFNFTVPTAGADSTADLDDPASIPDSTHLIDFVIVREWDGRVSPCDTALWREKRPPNMRLKLAPRDTLGK